MIGSLQIMNKRAPQISRYSLEQEDQTILDVSIRLSTIDGFLTA